MEQLSRIFITIYYQYYQCIREDQLSYLSEFPAESLERDWKQEPSSAALYVPWRKLFLSTAQGLKTGFVNASSLSYLLQFQSAGTGPAQWAPPGHLQTSPTSKQKSKELSNPSTC